MTIVYMRPGYACVLIWRCAPGRWGGVDEDGDGDMGSRGI